MFPMGSPFLPGPPVLDPRMAAQILGEPMPGMRQRRVSFGGPMSGMNQRRASFGGPIPNSMIGGRSPGRGPMMGGMGEMPMPGPMHSGGMRGNPARLPGRRPSFGRPPSPMRGVPAAMLGRRPSFGGPPAQPGRNFDPSRIVQVPGMPGNARPAPSRRSSIAARSPADPLGLGMGGGIPRENGRDGEQEQRKRRSSFFSRRRRSSPAASHANGFRPFGRLFNVTGRGKRDEDDAALETMLRSNKVLAQGERGYDKLKSLKQGGQSEEVNLVRSRANGKVYVEKRIRTDQDRTILAIREIQTLQIVSKKYGGGRNLNVMVDYASLMGGRIYSLILEHCNLGNLESRVDEIRRQRSFLNEVSAWNVLQGVSRGLAFLHDGIIEIEVINQPIPKPTGWNTICHLDIKPSNIFLDERGGFAGQPRVILADFGCAVALNELEDGSEQDRQQPCGTPAWYPPEGAPGVAKFYGTKTDIYMLGATIHTLCRLLELPRLRQFPPENPCGSQTYGRRLNGIVAAMVGMPPHARPAARNIASYATGVLLEKAQKQGRR